jgi:hypothetical protein
VAGTLNLLAVNGVEQGTREVTGKEPKDEGKNTWGGEGIMLLLRFIVLDHNTE